MADLCIEEVKKAYKVLSSVARKTNLTHSASLSKENNIYLKSENLQLTGSFKLRGAYYKISKLNDEEKKKGVIACSAGNHAQGVALGAKEKGIKATIFMPLTAPISKVEATRSYGADVKLIDGVYGFFIKFIRGFRSKNLTDKHFTKRNGQLVNQPADA